MITCKFRCSVCAICEIRAPTPSTACVVTVTGKLFLKNCFCPELGGACSRWPLDFACTLPAASLRHCYTSTNACCFKQHTTEKPTSDVRRTSSSSLRQSAARASTARSPSPVSGGSASGKQLGCAIDRAVVDVTASRQTRLQAGPPPLDPRPASTEEPRRRQPSDSGSRDDAVATSQRRQDLDDVEMTAQQHAATTQQTRPDHLLQSDEEEFTDSCQIPSSNGVAQGLDVLHALQASIISCTCVLGEWNLIVESDRNVWWPTSADLRPKTRHTTPM